MDGREHIVQLGKVLRAEYDNNCDDSAAPGGMERFLTDWRLAANGALKHPQVQQALELLAGYSVFDATTRRARVGIALERLRELFRPAATPTPTSTAPVKAGSQTQNSKLKTQNSTATA